MEQTQLSIIIPFYNGERFTDSIINNIEGVIREFKDIKVEFLIVVDSPKSQLNFNNRCIKIIKNKQNMGIHYSRVHGLKESIGKYIIFLDQDDEIIPSEVFTAYTKLLNNSSADIIVSNGFFEFPDKKLKRIYSHTFNKKTITKEFYYLNVKSLIISPGQCIIKKDSIPLEWIEHIMDINGTDDYLLWLLMFNSNKKFLYNDRIVYIHKDSGENVSFNPQQWKSSLGNMEKILNEIEGYEKFKVKKIKRLNEYKFNLVTKSKVNFFVKSLKNLDLFWINFLFYVSNGHTVKNHRN